MKKNQRNHLNNSDRTDGETRLAEKTARILESHQEGQLANDDVHIIELGNLIRQTHKNSLPERNSELRQMLLDELEANEDCGAVTPVSSSEKVVLGKINGRLRSSRRFLALAVGLMLATGMAVFFLNPAVIRVAKEVNETSDLALESSGLGGYFLSDDVTALQPMQVEEFGEREFEVFESKKINQQDSVDFVLSEPESAGESTTSGTIVNLTESRTLFSETNESVNVSDGEIVLGGGMGGMGGVRDMSQNSAGKPPEQYHRSVGTRGSVGPAAGGIVLQQNQTSRSFGLGNKAEGLATSDNETTDLSLFSSYESQLQSELSAPDLAGQGLDYAYGDYAQNVDHGMVMNDYFAVRGGRGLTGPVKGKLIVNERFGREYELTLGRHELESKSGNEQYNPIHENRFIAATGAAAISTFSVDVDTAAYANMRRFINSGQLPPPDSIRIEELVNYFKYDYPQPTGDDPFSVNMELATCPWDSSHKLLRVGLKGKDVHVAERPPTNVVFLIDVSGSMNSDDKLPLLKRGFQMMVNELTENDRVSIVTYAGNAGVVLEPISGDQHVKINAAIENLTPGGSTHGSAGIELAYKLAQQEFITDGANKVILATDGDLNVGITEDTALVKLIQQKASENVFLTVLGFGTGNLKDGKMEQLADNGNGLYAYIDSLREARKVLVEQLSGSLVTIAKDVKIQIEFNPAEVKSYRLIGYENRLLETQDFDNDKKDAGEIGAGHTVTALYELVTTDTATTLNDSPPATLKYQQNQAVDSPQETQPATDLASAADSGELLTLALRFKQPDSNTSKRIEFTIDNEEKSFAGASADFRFAASVASFGMLLRGSQFAGDASPNSVQDIAMGAMGDDGTGIRAEFVDLVRKTVVAFPPKK